MLRLPGRNATIGNTANSCAYVFNSSRQLPDTPCHTTLPLVSPYEVSRLTQYPYTVRRHRRPCEFLGEGNDELEEGKPGGQPFTQRSIRVLHAALLPRQDGLYAARMKPPYERPSSSLHIGTAEADCSASLRRSWHVPMYTIPRKQALHPLQWPRNGSRRFVASFSISTAHIVRTQSLSGSTPTHPAAKPARACLHAACYSVLLSTSKWARCHRP